LSLAQGNIEIPMTKLFACSARIAIEYLSQGSIDDWLTCVLPFEPSNKDWSPTNAAFSLIIPSPSLDGNLENFFTHWSRATINDPFISLVVDASPTLSIKDIGTTPLLAVLTKFAESIQGKAVDDIWGKTEMYTQTVMTMKGLLALLHPTPFMGGTNVDDVSFIIPLGKRTKGEAYLDTSAIPSAKGLSRWLVKASDTAPNSWKQRHDLYVKRSGAEGEHGKKMNELVDKLNVCWEVEQDIAKRDMPSASKDREELMATFMQNVQVWRTDLRPEGTLILENIVADILQSVADRAMDNINTDIDTEHNIKILSSVKAALSLTSAILVPKITDLTMQVSEVVSSYEETSKARALEVRIIDFCTKPSMDMLVMLNLAYSNSRTNNLQKTVEDLIAAWPEALRVVCKSAAVGSDVAAGLEFLANCLDDPMLSANIGTVSAKQDQLVTRE
jgi:hypothetical protein